VHETPDKISRKFAVKSPTKKLGGKRQFLYLHTTMRKHLLCLINKKESILTRMTDGRLAAVSFAHRNADVYT
jgi:hypothetical protein